MKTSGRSKVRAKQTLCDTVENMNAHIVQKINALIECITTLEKLVADSDAATAVAPILNQCAAIKSDATSLLRRYRMSSAGVLESYYSGNPSAPDQYYMHLSADGILTSLDRITHSCKTVVAQSAKLIGPEVSKLLSIVEYASNLTTTVPLKTKNIEICKCGANMTQVPEFSELRCPNEACGRVKTLIGVQFRDSSNDDNVRVKHGGYDHSRHFKFWFDRLQARESFVPAPADLENIAYVMARDSYEKTTLSCNDMRKILRDPKVGASRLNDHAVMLVVKCGGPPPPRFTFQEETMLASAFDRVMSLYPDGGNKPYYPGLIGRIILWKFRDNPEKLRLIDYIHIQSCETEIKNDRIYEDICNRADPTDDLKFVPFDPARRR